MRPVIVCVAILLSACRYGDGNQPSLALGVIESLVLFGEHEACSQLEPPLFSAHDSYLCLDEDGYRYQLDVPSDRVIDTGIVVLHGAGSDARESREMVVNNSEYRALRQKILLYPQAKRYIFGNATLWNGSGEREPEDNGCCVNNALADRFFISRVMEQLRTALPTAPIHVVGLSNGGMLAWDLAFNTQIDVHTYFMVVASDQTTGLENPLIDANVVIIGARDDEVIPFFGGWLDFSGFEFFAGVLNAGNSQVRAPSFDTTMEKIATLKDCTADSGGLSKSGLASVRRYQCNPGMLATMVFDVSGHRLGAESLVVATPQRQEVMTFVTDWIDNTEHGTDLRYQ